jgi:hypothetical protein
MSGSNDSIAEYCIMAEVRKKFEKKVQKRVRKKVRKKSLKKSSKKCLKKSLLKKFENITNCRRGGEGGRVENCHSNACGHQLR